MLAMTFMTGSAQNKGKVSCYQLLSHTSRFQEQNDPFPHFNFVQFIKHTNMNK